MENIDYNDIIQYINQVIIGQRIKYYSTVKKGSLFGGVAANSDKSKISLPIIKGILKVFGLDEKKGLGQTIFDSINNQSVIIITVFLSSIIGILAGLSDLGDIKDPYELLLLSGIIGVTLLATRGFEDLFNVISRWFSDRTVDTTIMISVLKSFEKVFSGFANLTGPLNGGSFLITGAQTASQFISFIYYLCKEMITRPLISASINTIKSLFSSPNPESINTTSSPEFFDELKSAFRSAWIQVFSENKSVSDQEILSQFIWDENSSNIKYVGNGIFSKIITELSSFKKIQMEITYGSSIPIYKIDSVENNSKSLIGSKQIPTALVICYMQDITRPRTVDKINISQYSFTIGPVGTSGPDSVVTLYKNGKEISTITRAYQAQLSNNPESKNYIKEVCASLFGLDKGDQDPTCSTYFYSAIGSSIEGILKTLGGVSHDIYGQIILAELPLLYDMIKRLGWQTRLTLTNQYELITVDEWVGSAGKRFGEYIKSNPKVKNLLEHIVKKINSNPEFLNLKYKLESVETLPKRRHRPKSNITVSRLVTLGDTLSLINKKDLNKVIQGGSISKKPHNLELRYLELKKSLSTMGQKLSSVTDKEIKEKIEKIITLEKEIEQINMKILSYVKLLKTNRNALISGKIISLDEIDSMLSQQSKLSSNHNKYIATLTSAFGKLQFVIDSQDLTNDTKQTNQDIYYSI